MIAACTCGQVALELRGRPIVSLVCYCDDCQAGAKELEALAGAGRFANPTAGPPS